MSLDLIQRDWDVVVVGTGIGGGIVGRALAEAGQKVLFVEQGPRGFDHERQGLSDSIVLPEARLERGYWPTPLHTQVNGREAAFFAPLGAGLGGSSVFYAGTLERPERHDLEDLPNRPHPTGGWPVGFDAMLPWYAAAARVFDLHGGHDPLSSETPLPLNDPVPANAGDAALQASMQRNGLHPYALNSAVRHGPGYRGCLGVKCDCGCKMDARSAGVRPALETGNAALLDRAEVTQVIGTADQVTGLKIRYCGETHRIRARRYVLAGGALGSPRLLLASTCDAWPEGFGNASGLVGRNLMFHLNEMIALWPPRGTAQSGPSKSISLRDLYHMPEGRMGTIQAMGIDVGYGEILHYLRLMLAQSGLPKGRFMQEFLRLPAALASRMFGTAKIFVGLMEDLPYAQNRVLYDPSAPGRLAIEYTYQPELLARRRAFRKAIYRAFKGHRRVFLSLQPQLNFGHPCGTLRYGEDRAKSVLRPDCRLHDVANLYVVDASFMPTSMGVNPSLTIAANALRVAHLMTKGAA